MMCISNPSSGLVVFFFFFIIRDYGYDEYSPYSWYVLCHLDICGFENGQACLAL